MLPEAFKLERPIVFFDTETTGTEVAQARIIELCGVRINPDRTREEFHQRFNPGVPIPPDATRVHGITNEMVAGEPLFRQKVPAILAFFSNCDLAGYNIVRFDVPLLVEELLRNGVQILPFADARFIDCYTLWYKKAPRSLSDALRFYTGEEHTDAHSALADVEATIKVFTGQMRVHTDLQPDLLHLHNLCTDGIQKIDYGGCFGRNDEGELIFTFGKNKGKRIADNHGMLNWMLDKDFTAHTKQIARLILAGEIK